MFAKLATIKFLTDYCHFIYQDGNSTVVSVASKRGGSGTDRLMEEYEHERKVKKRRARLVGATEEAFTHIRRIRETASGKNNE